MPSVDRIKARLTEPPSLAPRAAPFLPPGTARTTSGSPEFLPERSVGPEAWARPQHAHGVLPVSTAHRGDVRCDGRSHGGASAEGGRPGGGHDGVQGGGGGGAEVEGVGRRGRDNGGTGQ